MPLLRLLIKTPLAWSISIALWLSVLVTRVVFVISKRWQRRSQRLVLKTWGHSLMRVLNVHLDVDGSPPPGGLLVSNHVSYLDILILSALVQPRFVAKAEIRSWPLVGWFCRSVDIIFVDRTKRRDTVRVGQVIQEGLDQGDTIVLFPEGTSTHGAKIAPFKPPLLAPAAAAKLPVHYASLGYRTPPAAKPAFLSVCWWGETPFGPHFLELTKLPRIDATVRFGEAPVLSECRKEMARELQDRVDDLFVPIVDFVPQSPENPIPVTEPA